MFRIRRRSSTSARSTSAAARFTSRSPASASCRCRAIAPIRSLTDTHCSPRTRRCSLSTLRRRSSTRSVCAGGAYVLTLRLRDSWPASHRTHPPVTPLFSRMRTARLASPPRSRCLSASSSLSRAWTPRRSPRNLPNSELRKPVSPHCLANCNVNVHAKPKCLIVGR